MQWPDVCVLLIVTASKNWSLVITSNILHLCDKNAIFCFAQRNFDPCVKSSHSIFYTKQLKPSREVYSMLSLQLIVLIIVSVLSTINFSKELPLAQGIKFG